MREQLRLSIPSKGRLSEDTVEFFHACGFHIHKANPRQYEATIAEFPDLSVLFQRPSDIVFSLLDGSIDFGITGLDLFAEHDAIGNGLILLHDALGYGHCSLCLAIPETQTEVRTVRDLIGFQHSLQRPLKIATKYPRLTARFFDQLRIDYSIVSAEGTLELAPAIGYADIISDLVSSGQTLKDNRLKKIGDGCILSSQAVLAGNKHVLRTNQAALSVAKQLLEFFEAYQRAENNMAIFVNIRGENQAEIAEKIFSKTSIGGLNGPTISNIVRRDGDDNWHALHIIVHKDELFKAITELRAIGGSGVIVTPVTYIFEEEPPRVKALVNKLSMEKP